MENVDKNFLWAEIDQKAEPETELTSAEKDVLTRLPKPIPLEGPKIHQHNSKASKPKISASKSVLDFGLALKMGEKIESRLEIPSEVHNPFMRNYFRADKRVQPLEDVAKISSRSAHKMLKKSIATTLAFEGFETASFEAVNVLTDVSAEFITRLGRKMNAEDFQDALNSTLAVENGLETLADFYKRLIERVRRLETPQEAETNGIVKTEPETETDEVEPSQKRRRKS